MSASWQARGSTAVATIERVNRELLDIADRLVADYDDIATGSVLRCLSRAVCAARAKTADPDEVPALAELLAREMLARRREPWVPEQRAW